MIVVDSSGWLEFRLRGEEGALEAFAAMQKTRIVPLDEELALVAADPVSSWNDVDRLGCRNDVRRRPLRTFDP